MKIQIGFNDEENFSEVSMADAHGILAASSTIITRTLPILETNTAILLEGKYELKQDGKVLWLIPIA